MIAVVPAYEPSAGLAKIVGSLAAGFRGIVVVDDGSTGSAAVFDAINGKPPVTLLRHPRNLGKGAALKTAFAYVLERFPDADGVITVDADGQHLADDILSVAAEFTDRMQANGGGIPACVVGTRDFTRRGVPFRSRLGNLWTIVEFRLLTGRRLTDTQSGLRAFPLAMLPGLLEIPGNRYEYEIAVLVRAAKSGSLVTVPVTTVYLDGNGTSHFRPLADTIKTQRALFSAALGLR